MARGMLCAMHRKKLPSLTDVCKNTNRIVIFGECYESNECAGQFFAVQQH